jgi:N-ethylmaleimide reductase
MRLSVNLLCVAGFISSAEKTSINLAAGAGFDGVEVHAANGYLIDQFLRDGSNHRTDEFGGSLENRTRFLKQVLDTVTNIWGSDRVGVRLSPLNSFNTMSDSNPEALFSYVVEQLNAYNLAYLHVVEGSIMTAIDEATSFNVKLLSKIYQGNYIANSGYTKQIANEAILTGHADLISFGVDFIAYPDLVERLQHDKPLNVADQETFYGGDEKGYTDYPFLEAVI